MPLHVLNTAPALNRERLLGTDEMLEVRAAMPRHSSEPGIGFMRQYPELAREFRVQRYRAVSTLAAPSSNKAQIEKARLTFQKSKTARQFLENDEDVNFVTKELEAEIEELESRITPVLGLCILIAMTNTFLLGYHTSVMSAAQATTLRGHTSAEWTLAVSAMIIGGFIGASLAGIMSTKFGRNNSLMASTVVNLLGTVSLVLAPTMEVLTAARFTIGLASGVSMVVVPIYIGEIAPPRLRGPLGTGTQLTQCIGILASDLLELIPFTSGGFALFAVPAVITGIQLLGGLLLPLPPTPPFLVSKGGARREAVDVCKRLYALTEDEATTQVDIIAEALGGDDEEDDRTSPLLADRADWTLLISVLALHLGQQLSGINAIFYYATSFFKGTVDNPNIASALVALVNLLAVCGAAALMDHSRRRTLLMASSGGMLASAVLVTAGLQNVMPTYFTVVGVITFVAFFEIGLGPIPFLIVSEMYDTKRVCTAQTAASQMNWICNIAVGLGFIQMQKALGAYVFAPFGVVLLATFAYTMFVLPETLHRTPEEIHGGLLRGAKC